GRTPPFRPARSRPLKSTARRGREPAPAVQPPRTRESRASASARGSPPSRRRQSASGEPTRGRCRRARRRLPPPRATPTSCCRALLRELCVPRASRLRFLGFLVAGPLRDLVDDRGVGERRRVAELSVVGNV